MLECPTHPLLALPTLYTPHHTTRGYRKLPRGHIALATCQLLELPFECPYTVMLQYFACEEPLRFCHFAVNSSTLRSYLCDCGGGIPILGQSRSAEVGMYLTLLGLLLAGLLLQCTLHTLVHFASCHRSDCSVFAAGARTNYCLMFAILY